MNTLPRAASPAEGQGPRGWRPTGTSLCGLSTVWATAHHHHPDRCSPGRGWLPSSLPRSQRLEAQPQHVVFLSEELGTWESTLGILSGSCTVACPSLRGCFSSSRARPTVPSPTLFHQQLSGCPPVPGHLDVITPRKRVIPVPQADDIV